MTTEKCRIRKEDKVKVLTGRDKGKIGKVLKIDRKKGRLLVENINMITRHVRPNAKNRQGGMVKSEAAIHLSNVMLMCDKCMTPVRIRMKHLEDGKKVRECGKCSEII